MSKHYIVSDNLIPEGNGSYSIGNEANQFGNSWFSGTVSTTGLKLNNGASSSYILMSADEFGSAFWTASVPGASGTSGSSGTSGVSGTEGTSGSSGTSGTEGSSGTSGTEGTSGSSGTSGVSGTEGTSGSSGTSGTEGASGTNGTSGTSGPPGNSGSHGTSGSSGTSGTSGSQGEQGPVGAQGPQGPQGTQGPVGPAGLIWKGSWTSSATYSKDDAVGFAGSSWFCYFTVSVATSSAPDVDTASWALLSAQGTQGPQGSQGIQGATGPQGIQGSTGPAGPSVWGVITGTLSTQTDLQSALNSKLDIQPRWLGIPSNALPSINTNLYDAVSITALAVNITSMSTNLSGSPGNFQKLIIRIKDDGVSPRTINWGASFASRGATLPTTTVLSKVLTVGFIYNTVTTTWDLVALAQET